MRTDDITAKRARFGNRQTYRQAQKVLANGSPKLILAMDQGRGSTSAVARFADTDIREQDVVLEPDEKSILQAGREIRQRDIDKQFGKSEGKMLDKMMSQIGGRPRHRSPKTA